jgi:acid phosphatase
MQTAAEYHASAIQAYRMAAASLDEALRDPTWTAAVEQNNTQDLPPAVILDLDETVLNNLAFDAKLIHLNIGYSRALWKEWVSLGKAGAVPGSLEFARYAKRRGVEIFYVTNRSYPVENATRLNLEQLGFPLNLSIDVVLTRNEKPDWGHDKTTRRAFIAKNYRILLIIGDDLNDFISMGNALPDERVKVAASKNAHWGRKWILLPNPLHGSWKRSLYGYESGLSRPEKLERQYQHIRY